MMLLENESDLLVPDACKLGFGLPGEIDIIEQDRTRIGHIKGPYHIE